MYARFFAARMQEEAMQWARVGPAGHDMEEMRHKAAASSPKFRANKNKSRLSTSTRKSLESAQCDAV